MSEAARAGPRAAGRHARRGLDAVRQHHPHRTSSSRWFPGDEDIERRIRAFIRWNAAVMVVKANKHADGIGGHLVDRSPRRPALYEVGFNHFFRGQGATACPATTSTSRATPPRASTPARSSRAGSTRPPRQLPPRDRRRRPVELPAPVAHARLLGVPDGVDGPRPDQLDLPGPVQPATCRTVTSTTPAGSRVWCFVGDGETDEPETLGSISLAGREGLDNLIVGHQLQPAAPRRSGARQRQDHPGARGHVPRRRAGTSSR